MSTKNIKQSTFEKVSKTIREAEKEGKTYSSIVIMKDEKDGEVHLYKNGNVFEINKLIQGALEYSNTLAYSIAVGIEKYYDAHKNVFDNKIDKEHEENQI